jgi:hypothetical protein
LSNKKNPRRDGAKNEKRTENGPRYENANPGAGCNSTHVAKSRSKWKKRRTRSLRRNGETSPKVHGKPVKHPEIDVATAWELAQAMDLPEGATVAVFEEMAGVSFSEALDTGELPFAPAEE